MICIVLLSIVGVYAITPTSRSLVDLEPPLSFINFDTSLGNRTSQILFDGTSTYIFSRKCKLICSIFRSSIR